MHTRHKFHIPKLMFHCAAARPRRNAQTGEAFDGRIDMWSFAEWVPAQHASPHRDAGALELKSIPANKETYKQMLLNNVLPSIKAKWSSWGAKNIVLQHDNATPHRSVLTLTYEGSVCRWLDHYCGVPTSTVTGSERPGSVFSPSRAYSSKTA